MGRPCVWHSEKMLVKLQELREKHPFFTYWWNGREVYKFPVATHEEAVAVCKELWIVQGREDLESYRSEFS